MSTNPTTNVNTLSDAELEEIGMYRHECGAAVYPNGDPTWQHCDPSQVEVDDVRVY